MKTFIKMLRDDSGASAAEYALILAHIGAAVAIAAVTLGGAIGNALDDASNCINGANAACNATNHCGAVLRGGPYFLNRAWVTMS